MATSVFLGVIHLVSFVPAIASSSVALSSILTLSSICRCRFATTSPSNCPLMLSNHASKASSNCANKSVVSIFSIRLVTQPQTEESGRLSVIDACAIEVAPLATVILASISSYISTVRVRLGICGLALGVPVNTSNSIERVEETQRSTTASILLREP